MNSENRKMNRKIEYKQKAIWIDGKIALVPCGHCGRFVYIYETFCRLRGGAGNSVCVTDGHIHHLYCEDCQHDYYVRKIHGLEQLISRFKHGKLDKYDTLVAEIKKIKSETFIDITKRNLCMELLKLVGEAED